MDRMVQLARRVQQSHLRLFKITLLSGILGGFRVTPGQTKRNGLSEGNFKS